MLENLALGFSISLSPENLLFCLIGCTLGTMIGVLPGLGPTATIAMLLSFTYKLDLTSALIMLAGIYYGAQYGGTITSILLKLPGESSTVVTVIDGHQMALKGMAGKALGVAGFGSFIAGTAGTLGLSLLAPSLAQASLMFGPPEFTALMILGLTLVIYLGSGSTLKAVLMGALGLGLGVIGMDHVTASERFTFGSQTLVEGVNIGILAMGVFGIGEIFYMAERTEERAKRDSVKCPRRLMELLPDRRDWGASIMPIGRGTVLGFFLGIIPGGGAIISSFASYALEKKISRSPDRFGKGAIEGVAGPESANNSAVNGAMIPLLTLGIPSNVVMALLLGAFMLHGVTPGPFILKEHPDVFWGLITSMYIGNLILIIQNIPGIKVFVKLIEVPSNILSPLIALICVIGAYSINNNHVDVLLMMCFGGLGYFIRKFDYEPAPLLLAFVLGPMLEKSLRQTLIGSQGSLLVFLERPLALVLLVIVSLIIAIPIMREIFKQPHRSTSKGTHIH